MGDDTHSSFSGDNSDSPLPFPAAVAAANASTNKNWKLILVDEEGYDDADEDEEVTADVKPIGNVVRVSDVGESRRNHFNGFQACGVSYFLEDIVLVVPEEHNIKMKPSVAIIKDITASEEDGRITVTGQRFYRPEVAENENGENWKPIDSRELFYSFDYTKFSAELVMHKCRVFFIPSNIKIPSAKKHPGFIVRKVYDSKYKELNELLDTCFEGCRGHEINVLVQKTIDQIPELATTDEEEGIS